MDYVNQLNDEAVEVIRQNKLNTTQIKILTTTLQKLYIKKKPLTKHSINAGNVAFEN